MSTTLTTETAARLAHGLELVRQRAGLADGSPAELVRYTINAVYRIGDHVFRLAPGAAARDRAQRVVRVTHLLARRGVPVAPLVEEIDQPVVAGEWVATVWQYLPLQVDRRPTASDLVAPLRYLHALTDTPDFLPQWSPIDTARRRLAAALTLPAAERDYTERWVSQELHLSLEQLAARLMTRCDDLQGQLGRATWHLSPGMIHGDAHIGNLLIDQRHDRVVLCDFDSMAIGPREWDFVPLAHSAVRFGDPVAPYRQFADGYGFDLTTSDVWPLLRDVRELQLVTSVIDKISGRPEMAQILAHRLQTYLRGDRTAVWIRYR